MSHLSDKELDRLSREAAEQFDVEGSTSGWDALEKKLDKSMPTDNSSKRRRGLWFWLTGSLLIIGTLAYLNFYAGKKKSGVADQNQVIVSESQNTEPDNSITKNQVEAGNKESRINDQVDANESNEDPSSDSHLKSGTDNEISPVEKRSETVVVNSSQKEIITSQKTGNKVKKLSGSKVSSRTRISGPTTSRDVSQNDINNSNRLASVSKIENTISVNEKNSEEVYKKQISIPGIEHQYTLIDINGSTHADSMIMVLANTATPERDTTIKPTTIFPFEAGMLVGSDMSNVNFQGNDRVGLNFGISVGYRFNRRWQINTGLIHTKKYYYARGKDFNPPKGYWTDYVDLEMVKGNCSMWEIPLNIRYDLSLTRKGNWFVSSGLSTYLMQQEDYDYHYWSNGNYYTRHKGYPSSEKSILGILNLSGGFERNFTPHVSVQFEPYLRIPLKGVGFGNLQMNSFGTNFILKFKSGHAKK